jgi:hypothetical protein
VGCLRCRFRSDGPVGIVSHDDRNSDPDYLGKPFLTLARRRAKKENFRINFSLGYVRGSKSMYFNVDSDHRLFWAYDNRRTGQSASHSEIIREIAILSARTSICSHLPHCLCRCLDPLSIAWEMIDKSVEQVIGL